MISNESNTPLPLFFYDNFFKMQNTILCKEERGEGVKVCPEEFSVYIELYLETF